MGDRAFLDRFESERRSLVTNLFLAAVRAGTDTPEGVVSFVTSEVAQRMEAARRFGQSDGLAKAEQIRIALFTHREEALALAGWALEWERLPASERDAIKRERAEGHQRAWSRAQPATEAQTAYLANLGHAGPVASRQHASELIDRLTRTGAAS